MGIIDRIKDLISALEISEHELSKRIMIPKSSLNRYMTGQSKPSLELIMGLAAAFPDLSLEWLLRGNGSMFSEDEELNHVDDPSTDLGVAFFMELMDQVKQNARDIEQLKKKA